MAHREMGRCYLVAQGIAVKMPTSRSEHFVRQLLSSASPPWIRSELSAVGRCYLVNQGIPMKLHGALAVVPTVLYEDEEARTAA